MPDEIPASVSAAATKLGKRAAGKPKNFSKAELARRRLRMIALNKERVAGNSAQRRKAKRAAERKLAA